MPPSGDIIPPKFGHGINKGESLGVGSISLDERTGTELLMRGLSRMSDIHLDDLEVRYHIYNDQPESHIMINHP